MKTLVTGGAGFIGSHLVDRLLAEGHDVDVIDDLSSGGLPNLADARADGTRRFTFHRLDIRQPDLVDLIKHRQPEVIFHLAAQPSVPVSVAQPGHDAEVNILGSLNVLQGAVAAKARKIVFAASGGTLYGEPDDIPTKEGSPQLPICPYGVSKKAVLDYLRYYREAFDLEYTALALANVYGPRQDPMGEAGVVAIFTHSLLRGQRPTINGDGEHTRDFVFVDDVVDGFVRGAEKADGLLVNIGTGVETSVQRVYDVMAAVLEIDGPANYGPERAGDTRRSALDPGRAEIHLGWTPFTSFEEGIARTLAWFRERT